MAPNDLMNLLVRRPDYECGHWILFKSRESYTSEIFFSFWYKKKLINFLMLAFLFDIIQAE
jgi:hypothetical protein